MAEQIPTSFIAPEARLGANVRVGRCSVIHDNVELGDDVEVGDHCTIGAARGDRAREPLVIGAGSRIRSHTTLYEGSRLGAGLETGHHVLIREGTVAGESLRVGSYTDIEGACEIGDFVSCHSYVHVGRGSKIGHFVWLYSLVTLTNDPLPPSFLEDPVTLEDGVVVCVGCTVLPGTLMREGAYATAGTVVRGEIGPGKVVSPEDTEAHVTHLIHLDTMTRHPWMNHYRDRYPKKAHARIKALRDRIKTTRSHGR